MQSNVLPVTDEQAKALGKALDIPIGFGAYLAKVLGTVPEDLVGILGGDKLKIARAENMLKAWQRMQERHKLRGVKETVDVGPNIALPLLEAAANESRDQLLDLWASLMAAATDPKRSNSVRQSFIEAIKKMDPLDALVLPKVLDKAIYQDGFPNAVARMLESTPDEVMISLQNLETIGLVAQGRSDFQIVGLTVKGRELMRILRD